MWGLGVPLGLDPHAGPFFLLAVPLQGLGRLLRVSAQVS